MNTAYSRKTYFSFIVIHLPFTWMLKCGSDNMVIIIKRIKWASFGMPGSNFTMLWSLLHAYYRRGLNTATLAYVLWWKKLQDIHLGFLGKSLSCNRFPQELRLVYSVLPLGIKVRRPTSAWPLDRCWPYVRWINQIWPTPQLRFRSLSLEFVFPFLGMTCFDADLCHVMCISQALDILATGWDISQDISSLTCPDRQ